MDYRRIVSYIYAYQAGEKEKNVGFAKIETRNMQSQFTINLKGLYTETPENYGVYLFSRENDLIKGIKIGEMVVSNGIGNFHEIFYPQNIVNSGYSIDKINGIFIGNQNNKENILASQWDEIEINVHNVVFPDEAAPAAKQVPAQSSFSNADSTVRQSAKQSAPASTASTANQSDTVSESSTSPTLSSDSNNTSESVVSAASTDSVQGAESAQSSSINSADDSSQRDSVCDFACDSANSETVPVPMQEQPDIQTVNATAQYSNVEPHPSKPADVAPDTTPAADTTETVAPGSDTAESATTSSSPSAASNGSSTAVPANASSSTASSAVPAADIHQGPPVSQNTESAQSEEKSELDDTLKSAAVATNPVDDLYKICDSVDAFDDDDYYDCIEVAPDNLKRLPLGDINVRNNSFMMHGFYNFKHLLFGKVQRDGEKNLYFIGVPGIYSNRERFMASMYGFNNFKRSHRSDYRNPYFGYWYMEVYL